jgi:AcrR family transcriptional regulator
MLSIGMKGSDTVLRARPKQARSRETMQRLLDQAEALLVEFGVNGFNTNLLADRSGVGPRAVYRYFPNKWAVLTELVERSCEREREWIGSFRALRAGTDWRRISDRMVDSFYFAARRSPVYALLRAACQVSPQLQSVDARHILALETNLAAALMDLGVELDEMRRGVICRIIIETSGRVIDLALKAEPEEAALLIAELKGMIHSLVAPHIAEPAES